MDTNSFTELEGFAVKRVDDLSTRIEVLTMTHDSMGRYVYFPTLLQ